MQRSVTTKRWQQGADRKGNMIDLLLLIAGLAILFVGGDILIRGAVGVAERLHVPPLIIGLTIVAMGTSAPELMVSLKAALEGAGGISIGNVIGSNLANVMLVLAVPSLIRPTPCRERGIGRNIAVMVAITIVFMVTMADGMLTRADGIILLVLLGLFLFDQLRTAQKHRRSSRKETHDHPDEPGKAPEAPWLIAAMLIGGLIALPIGADLTVRGASAIAASLGVPQEVIGLTVVGIGTSLPEVAASLLAVMRNHSSVALGNVVGSNIFNIGLIMGTTATTVPVSVVEHIIRVDMWMMLAAALLIAVFAKMGIFIGRKIAAAMIAVYSAYVVLLFAM